MAFGYGKKTFVQGLARACKRLATYITKHDKQLRTYLPPAAYACVVAQVPCLLEIAALANESAG